MLTLLIKGIPISKRILYFLTPGTHISAFDVTIAADAGFDLIIPFTEIRPDGVANIGQDAIFSRPPKRFKDTGIFIGGRDVHLATDMFQKAKNAMVNHTTLLNPLFSSRSLCNIQVQQHVGLTNTYFNLKHNKFHPKNKSDC